MANKPLTPLSSRQVAMIVGNIRKVMTTKTSKNLTKQSYDFLYQASGFIAHYNIYGFQIEYTNTVQLAIDILNNKGSNQWNNFRTGEEHYDYYMAKKVCYNAICDMLVSLGYRATRRDSFLGW